LRTCHVVLKEFMCCGGYCYFMFQKHHVT
jgi:hypothetical protein